MAHSTVCSTITVSVWLWAYTGLQVQHSLTVITINSSLTQCTVRADKIFTNVYAISCQLSAVIIVTYSVISIQQTYPTLNTLYHNRQQLCSTFICTEEHWKLILTAYCLHSTDIQHNDCYSLNKQHNICITITYAEALCAAVATNIRFQQNIVL